MVYPIRTNIIPLFHHLVEAIRPFADANSVVLGFKTELDSLEIDHHPALLAPDLTLLLCRIITFTPQAYEVQMHVAALENYLLIRIQNTGVNLAYLEAIHQGLKLPVAITALEQEGTLFEVKLLLSQDPAPETTQSASTIESEYDVPVFYKKLRKHLHAYYANIQNLEKMAAARGPRDGVFLKKVNAIILANLNREGFDIAMLSKGLALSRAQLYRRLKGLIQQSPSQYIRFVRLQKAKEYLESTDMSVGEVAFEVGFADNSHFSRVFKKHFGFNPSHLRKKP